MEKPLRERERERERERVEATQRDRDREGNELQRECAKRERTQLTKRDKVYCIIMGDLQEAEIHKQGKTSSCNSARKNTTTSKTYMRQGLLKKTQPSFECSTELNFKQTQSEN
jgi:hypothetical protein